MSTFFRHHPSVSKILLASIWLLVAYLDLAGNRVVKGNIQLVLQRHEQRNRQHAQQRTTV